MYTNSTILMRSREPLVHTSRVYTGQLAAACYALFRNHMPLVHTATSGRQVFIVILIQEIVLSTSAVLQIQQFFPVILQDYSFHPSGVKHILPLILLDYKEMPLEIHTT